MQEADAVMGRDFNIVYKQTSGILPAFFPNMDSLREDVFSAGQELTRILLERINGEKPSQLQTLASPQPHWRPQPAEDLSNHDPS